ncbi:Histone deacetylase HDA1 [Yarrowia sp. B02]|nr:Histone deacetylase HDA1 [Yarrowia sp. B02]
MDSDRDSKAVAERTEAAGAVAEAPEADSAPVEQPKPAESAQSDEQADKHDQIENGVQEDKQTKEEDKPDVKTEAAENGPEAEKLEDMTETKPEPVDETKPEPVVETTTATTTTDNADEMHALPADGDLMDTSDDYKINMDQVQLGDYDSASISGQIAERMAQPIKTEFDANFVPQTLSLVDLENGHGKRKFEETAEGPELDTQRARELILDADVNPALKAPQLRYIPLKTGVCYDVRMRYHARLVSTSYDYVDPHPEDPRRIFSVYKALVDAGLVVDPEYLGLEDIGPLMEKIPIREASLDEVLEVHTPAHVDFLASTEKMNRPQLLEEGEKGDSVYFNNESFSAGKLSCGGTIETCRAVIERNVKNAIAVVRPPGHHAEPGNPAGFCMFSNVAVAAKVLLKRYPERVKRILILDWDVHHGNGTQRAFLDDPRVLYISLHQYENGKFYPGGTFGAHTSVGTGAGEGYSVNIPWSAPGAGDADYIYAFQKLVMPIGMEFDPDFVIVSAGFDAAEGDLLGGCKITPSGYGHMTHMLKGLASGNLAVVLEGGYTLEATAKSALAVTKVLLGEAPLPLPAAFKPTSATISVVQDVVETQSQYWRCLQPGFETIIPKEITSYDLMGDVVRSYQARKLFDKYKLSALPNMGGSSSTPSGRAATAGPASGSSISLADQILASPKIHAAETVVVFVHDPPQIWGKVDAVTGELDFDSCMVDVTTKWLEWAHGRGYGIIDVNIPKALNGADDDNYYALFASQEVCLYLWDKYLSVFDAANVIMVGFGDAYAGLVHLVGHRDTREKVNCVINFISETQLRPIVSIIDEYITDWFYRSSLVFTADTHPCWDVSTNPKKPRRKFGRVLRCDSTGLHRIVEERFKEAIEFIDDQLEDDEE